MKKRNLLILCAVFILLLIGASVLYTSLSGSVASGNLATTPPETQTPVPSETVAADTQPAEPVDYSAPDFTMLDMDGNEVSLRSFVGNPIILNFWASWCGPCKMEMPDIQKFYEQYGSDIHFLIVNCTDGSRETVDTAKEFLAGTDYTFPVYFDTTSAGAYTYGASSIPLTFFIDAQGNLAAYYMGAMSQDILQQGVDLILPKGE